MAFGGKVFHGISLAFLLATGALAEPSVEEALASVVEVATSWPQDMRDLPVYAGEVVILPEAERPPSVFVNETSLQGQWHGSAGVYSLEPGSPEFYHMDCQRIDADFLRQARAMQDKDLVPTDYMDSIRLRTRDLAAEIIPVQAEAVMFCAHSFQVDGSDEPTVRNISEQAAGKWFTAFHMKEMPGIGPELIAKGWSGDPANGVALLRVFSFRKQTFPDKVDMLITSYSWRFPDGS